MGHLKPELEEAKAAALNASRVLEAAKAAAKGRTIVDSIENFAVHYGNGRI